MAAAGSDELAWMTLEQAADMVRRRKVSPVELTQACLRRIEKLNPSLDAFITVTAEAALLQARAAEKTPARSPLHGIPIALKDLYDTAGVKTTAASQQYADRVPAEDADVVRTLKAAGAVILGKLNMDEFAYNFTGESSYFGVCRNPWDKSRSPGGSSGGSAVAVATGMCYGALGSDTGGSIRLPASFCGITGLKPTYGKIGARGVTPLAWSLDHVGPMCRTARDAAIMLGAMASGEATNRGLKSIRLGVPRVPFYEQLDAEVDRAMVEALKELTRLTAGANDVTLPVLTPSPELPFFPRVYHQVITAEAYAFHEEMIKRQPDRYHPMIRSNIQFGAAVSAGDYIRARRELERLREESGVLFEKADLLITPTAHAPALELGKPATLLYLRNTAPWNLYGLPTISIPCGLTASGLPIGMQITGRRGADDLVLALAGAYQKVTGWHAKRPLL